jgi:alkaline phosphatase
MSNSSPHRRALPVCLTATLVGGALVLVPSAASADGEGSGRGSGSGGGHGREARSVIFVNGDGMGASHREAARLAQEGYDGQLAMNSLPVAGLQTTDARDPEEAVTDSAAAASAWATGVKTYNGAISVDVDGNPLPTIGQEVEEAGLAGGIVTTAQVTDASPAAFFANSTDRAVQDQIARQYLEVSRPEVILGGGEDWWLPAGDPGAFPDAPADDPEEGSRSEQGDLLAEAQDLGYEYVTDAAGLAAAEGDLLLGLFANEEMFQQRPEGQGDEYDPVVPLADMTAKALEVLSRHEDGFFLLVEEEAVDEMSHSNNAADTLEAMAALDAAVEVAQAYVAEHPDTLLVVTGDHETGGMAIENVDDEDESGPGGTLQPVAGETESGEDGPFSIAGSDLQFVVDWTTTAHSGEPTPVTAGGPGSEQLSGIYPNTHLHDVVREVLVG